MERPRTAFMLSLVGGIFILLGGWIIYGGLLGPGVGIMGSCWVLSMLGMAGLVSGVIVIASAFLLSSKPSQHLTWGMLIIIFSVASIFGSAMSAFMVSAVSGLIGGGGLILGLMGGVLAVTRKPADSLSQERIDLAK